jgi:hypothetical protein
LTSLNSRTETQRIYRIIEKLLIRLNQTTYDCQGIIYRKCDFTEKKDEDSRVAIMGFIRGEIIATYFQFINLKNATNSSDKNLTLFRQSIGEIDLPNNALLELLKSNIRMNFANNVYSLLESGHRNFFSSGKFKNYKNNFDLTLVNGFEILRHLRNSMHSNGLFFPPDKKDFICVYRGYEINFKNGDFVRYNYKLIYWIIRDSLLLFTEMAIDNLEKNPSFSPVLQEYNIEKYFDDKNVL